MNKNCIIKFRVSLLERKIIERKSREAGLSISSFVRDIALNKEMKSRLQADEIEAYRELSQAKLNFTRIANLIKNRQDISNEVRAAIELINHHLNKFK